LGIIKIDNIRFKKMYNIDIPPNIDIYLLQHLNIIGYGLIKDTQNNPLTIYINKEYRGNGYGQKLFQDLINIIKEKNKYKDITLTTNKKDIYINNIIKNNGGIEISEEKNKVLYTIPINKWNNKNLN